MWKITELNSSQEGSIDETIPEDFTYGLTFRFLLWYFQKLIHNYSSVAGLQWSLCSDQGMAWSRTKIRCVVWCRAIFCSAAGNLQGSRHGKPLRQVNLVMIIKTVLGLILILKENLLCTSGNQGTKYI